ncbi:MAG: hypothetical protein M3Y41_13440, partial [Pseudomonadota bacterium]|nr:hypothetical protein [Pseudomonadota bacterium]
TETVRDTVRRDEVKVEQASMTTPAPRHEVEVTQLDKKVPALQQDRPFVAPQAEARHTETARAETEATDKQQAAAFRPNVDLAQEAKKFGALQQDKKPGVPQVDVSNQEKGSPARKS